MGFDKYEKLKELKKLLDNNLISQDEYQELKNETLFSTKVVNSKESDYDNNSLHSFGSKTSQIEFEKTNINIPSNNELEKVNTKNNNILILFFLIVGVVLYFLNYDEKNSIINSTQDSKIAPENSSATNNSVSDEADSNTCSICGRQFRGRGYEEVSQGNWQVLTEGQGFICSRDCGFRHVQNYNEILEKHGYAPIDESQSSTSNHAKPNSNGFFTGSDGQLHQVSPCGYCHHTGFINSGDGMQVCPMCDGKGEKIY